MSVDFAILKRLKDPASKIYFVEGIIWLQFSTDEPIEII
jgi:hypothetical protein